MDRTTLGDGAAALGVVTNEPPLPWHQKNAELWRWKRGLSEPAVALPGGFYPDERFLRAMVLRDAARKNPPNLESAVADAFGVLSSVAVPLGTGVPGTDSGSSGGESPSPGGRHHGDGDGDGDWDGDVEGGDRLGDHTRWSAVRDHSKSGLGYYWRDENNPSVRRLLLRDAFLQRGEAPRAWPVSAGDWYQDAKPSKVAGAGTGTGAGTTRGSGGGLVGRRGSAGGGGFPSTAIDK